MKEKFGCHFLYVVFCACVFTMESWAVPVDSGLAGKAVSSWLSDRNRLGNKLGTEVEVVRSFTTDKGASFHVVMVRGGGFVVTSADTDIEPIVAFSDSPEFRADDKNPLWTMLDRDLSARGRVRMAAAGSPVKGVVVLDSPAAKWSRLTNGESNGMGCSVVYAKSQDGKVSDVRVEPLLQTQWGQEQGAFNFYTPEHYPCGCVATAGAQIMRYFCHPTDSISPQSFACRYETGRDYVDNWSYYVVYSDVSLTIQGGVYDWDRMPAQADERTSEGLQRAIGKLTSDIGIACRMDYAESGSGTGGYMLAPALTQTFGYANAVPLMSNGFSVSEIKKVLLPNLDARLPVLTSVEGPSGGHAVVADGYGYTSGTLYVHFNMGWSGVGDSWYAPPAVEDFNAVDGFVCNIYTSGTSNGAICSGRVLSSVTGLPVAGAKVSVANATSHVRGSCTTDEHGIYALILPAGSHTLTAENEYGRASRDVSLVACVPAHIIGKGYSSTGSIGNLCECDIELETASANVIRFNANGGVCDIEVLDFEMGASITSLPTPTRRGYAFTGWFTSATGGSQLKVGDRLSDSVTVYAHWKANTCSIGFNANGGTCLEASRSCLFDSQVGTLPGAKRNNYTFAGWYTSSSGGTLITAETIVSGNTTYYAHWSASGADFVVDMGAESDFKAVSDVGSAIEASSYQWTTSLEFPWFVTTEASVVGGSSARSCEISGWDSSRLQTWVVGPATLTFSYQLRTYTGQFRVACDAEELFERSGVFPSMGWEQVEVNIPRGTHKLGFSYTHPGAGYTGGWGNGVRLDNVSISGGSPYRPPIYAIVVFDASDAGKMESREVVVGQALGSLPVPARTGYRFLGWYDGTSLVSKDQVVNKSLELIARWETCTSYSVAFIDGRGHSLTRTYEVDCVFNLPQNPWSDDGRRLVGWTCSNGKRYDDGMLVFNLAGPGESVTLTAVWK